MQIAPIPGHEAFSGKLTRHTAQLLHLAWPVMLSRAGILLMAFVDIAMLGRYGNGAVGVSNLGLAIFVPFMVVAIGLCSGIVPVISQAHGAGNRQECGRAWRRALSWGVFVSTFAMILVWHGESWLRLFGQTEDLAVRGGAVPAAGLAAGFACAHGCKETQATCETAEEARQTTAEQAAAK